MSSEKVRAKLSLRCSTAATQVPSRKVGLDNYGDRLNSHIQVASTTRDPRLPNFCAAPCEKKLLSIGKCKAHSPGLAAVASPVQGSAARPHQISPVTVELTKPLQDGPVPYLVDAACSIAPCLDASLPAVTEQACSLLLLHLLKVYRTCRKLSKCALGHKEPAHVPHCAGSPSEPPAAPTGFAKASAFLTSYFPVWVAVACTAAVMHPPLFLWFKKDYVTAGLALTMLAMGTTLGLEVRPNLC